MCDIQCTNSTPLTQDGHSLNIRTGSSLQRWSLGSWTAQVNWKSREAVSILDIHFSTSPYHPSTSPHHSPPHHTIPPPHHTIPPPHHTILHLTTPSLHLTTSTIPITPTPPSTHHTYEAGWHDHEERTIPPLLSSHHSVGLCEGVHVCYVRVCMCVMWGRAYVLCEVCMCVMWECMCVMWGCVCVMWGCVCVMWGCYVRYVRVLCEDVQKYI